MLAKEAEGMRDSCRLLQLNLPLHHPGHKGAWTAPHPSESLGYLHSCRPNPLPAGDHCVILSAIIACPAGSLGPLYPCGLRLGLPSNTDHSVPLPPPKGLDFVSELFVLQQSGVK